MNAGFRDSYLQSIGCLRCSGYEEVCADTLLSSCASCDRWNRRRRRTSGAPPQTPTHRGARSQERRIGHDGRTQRHSQRLIW